MLPNRSSDPGVFLVLSKAAWREQDHDPQTQGNARCASSECCYHEDKGIQAHDGLCHRSHSFKDVYRTRPAKRILDLCNSRMLHKEMFHDETVINSVSK